MNKYDVLLFDLGGVLVDFKGLESLKELVPRNMDLEDMRKRWLLSSSVKKFETGQYNTMEFVTDFTKEWKLTITPSQFLDEFSTWANGPYDEALSLLDSLKTDYILACLSNCNELHWDKIKDSSGFGEVFHHLYSSHEIGVAKPDTAAFEHVLSNLGVKPESVAFFDDNQMNIEAAEGLGIESYKVYGLKELNQMLITLGIAP